jgi:hypothetical protein
MLLEDYPMPTWYRKGHMLLEDYPMPTWYRKLPKEQRCFWCNKVLPTPRQSMKIEVEILEDF